MRSRQVYSFSLTPSTINKLESLYQRILTSEALSAKFFAPSNPATSTHDQIGLTPADYVELRAHLGLPGNSARIGEDLLTYGLLVATQGAARRVFSNKIAAMQRRNRKALDHQPSLSQFIDKILADYTVATENAINATSDSTASARGNAHKAKAK